MADNATAYDAWKIKYIADRLGIDSGYITLSQGTFKVGMITVGSAQAGKIVGNAGKGTTDSLYVRL